MSAGERYEWAVLLQWPEGVEELRPCPDEHIAHATVQWHQDAANGSNAVASVVSRVVTYGEWT